MWRAIVPAVLGISLAVGSAVPAAAQRTAGVAGRSRPPRGRSARVVVVAAVPAVIYIGNIPVLVPGQQVVVVGEGGPVVVVAVNGLFYLNGVPIANLSPTQVIVVNGAHDPDCAAN